MVSSSQITPGMMIFVEKKIYRVESCLVVKTKQGSSFVKTSLRDLSNDKIIEKNFNVNKEVKEVVLNERNLEFLYPEGKKYLFLDIDNLEKVFILANSLSGNINLLKEGVVIKVKFYADQVFDIELPMFLELMVVNTQSISTKLSVANSMKNAVLETGAKIKVPLFIEVGDIIKIDTQRNEYIQRV